jgi:hypothetical protein
LVDLFASLSAYAKRRKREKSKENTTNLRVVAENGAIRPCTVLTLACTVVTSVSAPEFGIDDVVGR